MYAWGDDSGASVREMTHGLSSPWLTAASARRTITTMNDIGLLNQQSAAGRVAVTRRRSLPRLLVVAAVAVVLGVGLGVVQPVPASAATYGPTSECAVRKNTGWIGNGDTLWYVCLSVQLSWSGTPPTVTGGTLSPRCNANSYLYGTWSCNYKTYGVYWRSDIGAWEAWLNWRVLHYTIANPTSMKADCGYVRFDIKPNGTATAREFFTTDHSVYVICQ